MWLSIRGNRKHSSPEYMSWHRDNDLYPLEKLDLFYEYLELGKIFDVFAFNFSLFVIVLRPVIVFLKEFKDYNHQIRSYYLSKTTGDMKEGFRRYYWCSQRWQQQRHYVKFATLTLALTLLVFSQIIARKPAVFSVCVAQRKKLGNLL